MTAPQYVTPEELSPYLDWDTLIDGKPVIRIRNQTFPPDQKFMKWHGAVCPVGGQYGVNFFNEISGRMKRRESINILVTGSQGTGKSWWCLSFAQLFDPKF
jgi:hypothetical protein